MSTVAEHYATHLAPIYLWMNGGFDAAIACGATEIDCIDLGSLNGRTAVDLGAGFGTHTIPLARRGCRVVASDTSPILLDLLRQHSRTLPVEVVEDDLLNFQKHLEAKVDLILCMGDTLTHLPERHCVEQLLSHAAQSLHRGGKFVASFRDYSAPLIEAARFIPVRSDDDRILTCFLEYFPEWVCVHDVLHERSGAGWQTRVSSYKKLRLSPEWVCAAVQASGFSARVEPGLSGMVRVVAERV
jgi:SAM-dependent methyltransferase